MTYDRDYFFRLIDELGNIYYLEDEPQGWDKVEIYLKRDPIWHGLDYEYTNGDTELIFDCVAGKDFIEPIYQDQGVNGLIILEYGYVERDSPDTSTHIEYTGKLNLSTRKIIKESISCSVERSGLHDLVKSRWDTKLNLFASSDLDNNAITPVTPSDLLLHSKKLINNYNKKVDIEGIKTFTEHRRDGAKEIYFLFNTIPGDAVNSNIASTPGTDLGSTINNPIDELLYWFNLEADGAFTFDINLTYVYQVKLIRGRTVITIPKMSTYYLEHYLQINNNAPIPFSKTSGSINSQFSGEKRVNATLSNYQINLKQGDKVYFYAKFHAEIQQGNSRGMGAYIQTQSGSIDVKAETSTDPTYCKSILLHEALATSGKLMTGQDDVLYSEFFGRTDIGYDQDGCGAFNMLTNGFEIRKFDSSSQNYKPPTISFSSLLKSLNSIFCLGMSYEKIGGVDKIRIEKREYFYQDIEILELVDCGNYEEKIATDLIFNNLQIGYKKYLDEGAKILDEFNTQHQYLAPIKRFENPFSELSDLVASGYAIETTRRYQFQTTPQDSTQYDDETFIIAVTKKAYTDLLVEFFGGVVSYILLSIEITAKEGQKIQIQGSSSNDGIYTIRRIDGDKFYVVEPLVNELATVTLTNLSESYVTEKDEPFSTVQNLISPETSYNLRHTPKRMLFAWAKWLNGSFYFAKAGDIIKNTFFKQNGALITQLKDAENCTLGDTKRAALEEKGDIILADFEEKENIFIPEYCTFKSELTFEQLDLLKRAMTGQNTGFDYGYITVPIPGGKLQGWIYEMIYNPQSKLVSFTVLKKSVVLDNTPGQVNCLEFSDYTFDDFEATTLPKSIEKCLFENFN